MAQRDVTLKKTSLSANLNKLESAVKALRRMSREVEDKELESIAPRAIELQQLILQINDTVSYKKHEALLKGLVALIEKDRAISKNTDFHAILDIANAIAKQFESQANYMHRMELIENFDTRRDAIFFKDFLRIINKPLRDALPTLQRLAASKDRDKSRISKFFTSDLTVMGAKLAIKFIEKFLEQSSVPDDVLLRIVTLTKHLDTISQGSSSLKKALKQPLAILHEVQKFKERILDKYEEFSKTLLGQFINTSLHEQFYLQDAVNQTKQIHSLEEIKEIEKAMETIVKLKKPTEKDEKEYEKLRKRLENALKSTDDEEEAILDELKKSFDPLDTKRLAAQRERLQKMKVQISIEYKDDFERLMSLDFRDKKPFEILAMVLSEKDLTHFLHDLEKFLLSESSRLKLPEPSGVLQSEDKHKKSKKSVRILR